MKFSLPKKVRMTRNGIVCQIGQSKVNLDPKRAVKDEINFISHAHFDHLPSQNGGTLLSSYETNKIARLRGFEMQNHVGNLEEYPMFDSGHILGSKGILLDDIFYTGDICTRNRGFLKAGKVPKCKTLITECTFGLPEFIFPKLEEIIKCVNQIIADQYAKGRPVLLMGYQLGKAQTISNFFGHWEPLYYHDSVKKMNSLHQELGVDIKEAIGHSEAESSGLLEKKPWVMVAPMMSEKNPFIKHMKQKYNAVTIGFSGWAKTPKFSFGRRCDYSIPLSDHSDFAELVQMVEQTGAEKVYTIHGFVEEFAIHLQKLGIDASPLKRETLEDFF